MASQTIPAGSRQPGRSLDETSPLLPSGRHDSTSSCAACEAAAPDHHDAKKQGQTEASSTVLRIILILLIGSFTANADGSLVLATHPTIASEFNALSESSWLFVSFTLAGAATQAMARLLTRLIWMDGFLVGIGRSMGEVIIGRVVSGCGGSALNVLAMLIISDLVPIRDVASWQASLNLAATTGRSLGGPVGGWLADTVGWRWSFLGQVPVFLVAILLCLVYLPVQPRAPKDATIAAKERPSARQCSSLARIDFLGATLLALTILAFLLPLEIGGKLVSWTHPIVFILLGAAIGLGGLFAATEEWWAKEPIFPLDLLRHRDIVLGYLISMTQSAAQISLMFQVPLYFQVTQRVSNTVAGAHLFPAVAGNAVGAIIAGIIIKRTGKYKRLLIFATIVASASYLLLLTRWHGNTSAWEALYILPGGFGTGIVQSSVFIAIQAAVDPKNKGPALGGIWLTVSLGAISGLAAVSAVNTEVMRWKLQMLLEAMGISGSARTDIVMMASRSVDYIDQADKEVAAAVVAAYVTGLSATHMVSLMCSIVAIIASLCIREHKF
ncbi:hypothetical protein S40288_07798 [Stachybotrys chartarum IBT 40288]|nr:hypothetical protein S40288_07798 [Stachybotrys chartarum IBT 40288]